MADADRRAKFERRVADLLAVTAGLSVTQILALRRMTHADPDTSSWANERELSVVFDTILDRAVAAMSVEDLAAAADDQFDALLPPGDDDVRDKERWQLFDVTKKYLGARPKAEVVIDVPARPEAEDEDLPIDCSRFDTMFDETIARYTRRSLLALVVGPNHAALRPHIPVPFIAAPGFARSYEDLLRRYVLPDLRGTKRIQALASGRKWDETGSNRLVAMIQAAGSGNAILETWDSRWAAYGSEGIGAKARKGENPWDVFSQAAMAGGYSPPTTADIPLLHSVIRWEPESLNEAWRDVALLYQQEFEPKSRYEQAREGALRDGLVKRIRDLPKMAGDMLAVKAFFEFPKFDRMALRKLIHVVGGTDTERKRIAPGLVRFYRDLPP